MLLFDSAVLIDHLKGVEAARDLLASAVESDDASASVMTRVEIEGGMRSNERREVARLLGSLHLIPVSDAIATRAGQYLRSFRRSHQGIDIVDYVVAATAEEVGADLLTLNTKHFPMFKGLRRPY
jgi:predicted nucleic acid-binding protein